ncbi:MAG: hypothetical protein FRX49_05518 [Trebouxia sp. A1-2]|nr:MAG: hypothetical protein FRX49_05518 [Trebouxia sp. A1-2]
MRTSEDLQERDAENTDARPPPLNEAIFEDPALTFSEIQQAFDRACRTGHQNDFIFRSQLICADIQLLGEGGPVVPPSPPEGPH